jgi:hypothetical protein
MRGFYAFNSANFPGGFSVAVGDVTNGTNPDIIIGSSPGYVPVVAVFDGATLLTAPTVSAIKVIYPAPASFRGAILVQAAPNNGGGDAAITIQSDVVFATLVSNVEQGEFENELFESITSLS